MSSPYLHILYTGGTIGMQQTAAGLAPAAGFEARIDALLACRPELRDPTWRLQELLPLIDSANMNPAAWERMAQAILAAAADPACRGVLVLHGTDTLAYSAAALAFRLLGLGIPVLLTGSMLPAGVPDSDADGNLADSFAAFASGLAPGVQVQFHGERLPAARCTKQASSGWKAFVESARPRSGEALVETPGALRCDQPRQPVRVAVLPLFPGVDGATLRGLAGSGVQGLVLECYGSGTGPADDADFLAALAELRDAGTLVVALSQGARGMVELGTYAAGSGLADAGVISGRGMTREAALGKLHALLGAGLDRAAAAEWIGRNLCEEL